MKNQTMQESGTLSTMTHSQTRQSRIARSGVAAVAIMVMLLLLLAVMLIGAVAVTSGGGSGTSSGGAFEVASRGMRGTSARIRSATALNAAEAGVAMTVQWLTIGTGKQPPSDLTAFAPDLAGGTKDAATKTTLVGLSDADVQSSDSGVLGSECRVRVYPSAANADAVLKQYLIESEGICQGQRCVLQVLVQQTSFSKYAFFEHCWNGGAWNSDSRSYDGPVHINNINHNQQTKVNGITRNANIVGLGWFTDSKKDAIFTGPDSTFTTSAPQIKWYKDNNGPADTTQDLAACVVNKPTTDAEWKKVATTGKQSVAWGQPVIPVPENNEQQRFAVLGRFGASGAEANAEILAAETAIKTKGVGVTLCNAQGENGGGVYINGDVQQVTLAPAGTSGADRTVQTITVRQMNGLNVRTSVITVNPATQRTTLAWTERTPLGATTSGSDMQSGTTNGVVYVNGNVGDQGTGLGGIEGVVADNYVVGSQIEKRISLTIATATGKSVNLNGDIKYLTARTENPGKLDEYGDPKPPYIPESNDPNFRLNGGTIGIVAYNIKVSDRTSACTVPGTNNQAYKQSGVLKNPLSTKPSELDLGNANNLADLPESQKLRKVKTQAACFALNTYDVFGKGRTTSSDRHQNMGCYLQVNGGDTQSMNMVRLYDNRLANDPPPFFPTTGNRYQVLSWKRTAERLEL
ncbi:MAG: hypothetical protein H7Z41_13565 [Cytophagales bacterium]|nr:hypothetical protein [Armatimonadota bacterium]